MISGIGSGANYFSSLFATQGSGGSSGTSSLAQTEEKLFARIDTNGDGSLSQSEFTSFLDQAAAATGGAAPSTAQANALLAQLTQSAQSLVAGSAAGITSSNSSNATSNTNSFNSTSHHHHHGHGGGASLISQFMQQYQAAGATATTAASTLSATA